MNIIGEGLMNIKEGSPRNIIKRGVFRPIRFTLLISEIDGMFLYLLNNKLCGHKLTNCTSTESTLMFSE